MAEPNDRADLDSVLHQIELLTARVTATADRHESDGDDVVASELYDVERALRTASRRLDGVLRRLA